MSLRSFFKVSFSDLLSLKRNPDKFSFIHTATPKQRLKYGYLMWLCLWIGYFTFCFNWIVMGKLQGSNSNSVGWAKTFSLTSEIQTESSMYAVSFARGVATLAVAWFMVKVTHKWATIIALLFNTISLPLVFAPYFFLFVIGRMCMAFGGTMLIILVQPVLSRFFDLKQKGLLSTLTSMSYLAAGLVANLIFVYSGPSDGFLKKLQGEQTWKIIAACCAALSYFPLLAYPFAGKNFSTSDNLQQDIDQLELPKNTYKGVIKEKEMWLWIILYSFLLTASLLVSLTLPKIISRHMGKDLTTAFSTAGVHWTSIYTVCFFVGCFCGMCLGKWNKKEYRRKPFIILAWSAALFFLSIIMLIALLVYKKILQNNGAASAIIFISVFFFAFFAMGIQPVMLYVPHEYEENDNSKRITIFYSYLWGFGYIIFTIYQIIAASLLGAGRVRYDVVNFVFIFALIAGAIVCACFIRESRPQYKLHPWQTNER